MSELVSKGPCSACGSSDACATYDDSHTHCYSCGKTTFGVEAPQREEKKMSGAFLRGEAQDLISRKISQKICEKFGYWVGKDKSGKTVQIANYRDDAGALVAQKIRTADKGFSIVGDGKAMPLFGQHVWKGSGRRIVVTEGEIDALSVAEATGGTWDVVSLPNGAQSAAKAIKQALPFLLGYESVVLAFDMDKPGKEAAQECAPLFPPGKCAIASLPTKDASDMLQAGRGPELSRLLWAAKVWRPDGIINGADIWDRLSETPKSGIPYPWEALNAKTFGQHARQLVTWTAGSGVGKSTIVSRVAYELLRRGVRVGYVALEESVGRAGHRFLSHHLGKLTHFGTVGEDELEAAFGATLAPGNVLLFDHFGSSDPEHLLNKLRYLITAERCEAIVLDHISIAISGLGADGDERRIIDNMMTSLRALVEETGVIMHVISHLRRTPQGTAAEDGGKVSLSHLRGSHSIAQLSDVVIALERDLQDATSDIGLRILKNRHTGMTGEAGKLRYDQETGVISVAPEHADADQFKDESGDPPPF